jgi:dienelactone hydrolase
MRLGPVAVLLFFFFCIGPLAAQDREQVVRLPGPNGSTVVATVMRPPGEAKSPLVVINHGSPADGSQRYKMERPRYMALSSWFLSRGYVVALPLRRGYGETGGDWAEGYGLCDAPDYYRAGLQGAADIQATIDFMRTQPYVAADRTIVVGQSAGGWATVALSSRNPPGVAAMINFAGGRGGHQKLAGGGIGNCTPRALVEAAAKYGATARVPMLWIYAENDSFFEPSLARRMAEAYHGAGGKATYRPVGAFGRDGHSLAGASNGSSVWSPLVESFLAGLR